MTGNFANARLAVATMSILAIVSVRAQASQCSQASAAGYWAYTYTGTVYVPDAAPIASEFRSRAAAPSDTPAAVR
jgi:hypothetical protein